MKKSVLIGLAAVACSLLQVGCSKNDEPHDPVPAYEFEKYEYDISSEAQTVVLRLEEPKIPGFSNPVEWEYVQLQYYTVENREEVGYADRYVEWTDDPIGVSQYVDAGGVLCISLQIPANTTQEYRIIRVYAGQGLYFAMGCVIQAPPRPAERDIMRIRVDGKLYSSEYTYNEETGYEFADSEFRRILNMMEDGDRWRMVVVESDIVDYVDITRTDLDEYLEKLLDGIKQDTRAATAGFQYMGSGDIGYFAMFDNGDFKGSNIYKGLADLYASFYITNLKDWGMNDKISSVAVAYNGSDTKLCSVLTVWDDADWNFGDADRSKHRLSIIASSSNRQVSYSSLKNVKCLNSSKNWNDRISSISCHFGYWGRSMLDY